MSTFYVNRRWFLVSVGSAAISAGFLPIETKSEPLFGDAAGGGYEPTIWYEIRSDGRILEGFRSA